MSKFERVLTCPLDTQKSELRGEVAPCLEIGSVSGIRPFSEGRKLMRATLIGLGFAGVLSLVCHQSAEAVPANGAALKGAVRRVNRATGAVLRTSHPARRY